MDDLALNIIEKLLIIEMNISFYINTFTMPICIVDIENSSVCEGMSKENILTIMTNLVAHGIISAEIDDEFNLVYSTTEFGKYFINTVNKYSVDNKSLI